MYRIRGQGLVVDTSEHGNKISDTAKDEIFLLVQRVFTFQEGLCSMALVRRVL